MFLTTAISFLIVAFAVFLIVKGVSSMVDLVPLVARIRDWCDAYLLRHVGPVSTCGDSWCSYCGNQCHACGRIVVNNHLGRMPR